MIERLVPTRPVRVLVVDDSAFFRKGLSEMLRTNPHIQVVGSARDGKDALEKVVELQPDVLTLDLFMEGMSGVEFLRLQMARRPLPVVLVSSADEAAEASIAAIEAGAVEFVRKPTALALDNIYEMTAELVEKVLIAASVPPDRLPIIKESPSSLIPPASLGPPAVDRVDWQLDESPLKSLGASTALDSSIVDSAQRSAPVVPRASSSQPVEAILIGVSTGGPQALRHLLTRLPAGLPAAIAMVLHMPPGYTGPLAARLDQLSPLEVLEAEEGLEMRPGRAILARAGYHLSFHSRERGSILAHLDLSPDNTPHRPAVDVLFRSAAEVYGSSALGIVLTGMGSDGLSGASSIKSGGGIIFTEAEETCVVYGMPRSIVEAGLSDKIIPLYRIPQAILEMLK